MKISRELIAGLQAKDEKAFAELFDVCFAQLHELSYNYVLDYDIANDIVQETLIAIYEHPHPENIANLAAYLRITVRNRSLNYLRDLAIEDRKRMLYLDEFARRENIDNAEWDTLHRLVELRVNDLPEACRKICRMRFYDGLKIKEIAEILNLSESTIKTQLHRGIEHISETFRTGTFGRLNTTKCIILMIFLGFM